MTDKESLYIIAELLKQLGFRKETEAYIVKDKQKALYFFGINKNNTWHFKHYDFNGYQRYLPSMGEYWGFCGDIKQPIFQKFDKEGNIYSLPTLSQVVSFCTRRGILLRNCENIETVIADLIFAYRKKARQANAFSKYLSIRARQDGKQTKLKI